MNFKKYVSMLLAVMMLLAVLAGCGAQNDSQTSDDGNTPAEITNSVENPTDDTDVDAPDSDQLPDVSAKYEPVTIENFDRTVEFTEKPKRVVVLTLNSAEMIAALGEADAITAVAHNNNIVEDVLPEYYEILKNCDFPEVINSGIPTLEGMLSLDPDVVVCNSYYFNAPQIFGSMEDYQVNGVEFYITEGSYLADCTIENTYNDIRNLGAIFGKQAEAENVISNMQQRVTDVTEKVSGKEPLKVMSLDNIDEDSYYVAGGIGLAQDLITLAGGINVFEDSDKQFSVVNVEEIISRNPDVIVIHAYTYAGLEEAQAKIDVLMNTEELSEVPAVKNNNIIVVPVFQVNPSIQNINYVEDLAAAMYPELFN